MSTEDEAVLVGMDWDGSERAEPAKGAAALQGEGAPLPSAAEMEQAMQELLAEMGECPVRKVRGAELPAWRAASGPVDSPCHLMCMRTYARTHTHGRTHTC